jgi:hypothetical protein
VRQGGEKGSGVEGSSVEEVRAFTARLQGEGTEFQDGIFAADGDETGLVGRKGGHGYYSGLFEIVVAGRNWYATTTEAVGGMAVGERWGLAGLITMIEIDAFLIRGSIQVMRLG